MAIQYSGGTIVNYTFTDAGTRADLVAKLETQLGNAGWSTISGGGSSDVLMKSAVTAQGLSIRLRLYDPGSGNCPQFTIKNNAGTLTSSIAYLLPASAEWRIWACKYWFIMFRTGVTNRTTSRGVLAGGTIVGLPTNVLSIMGSDLDCGWMHFNGISDTDAVGHYSFRDRVATFSAAATAYGSSLYTSQMVNYTSSAHSTPSLATLRTTSYGAGGATDAVAWQDDSAPIIEPRIGWSSTSANTGQSKLKGFLADACILMKAVSGEATISNIDGHTWIAITDQGTNDGTLVCMVS